MKLIINSRKLDKPFVFTCDADGVIYCNEKQVSFCRHADNFEKACRAAYRRFMKIYSVERVW